MKKILIITHTKNDGLSFLETFLQSSGVKVQKNRVYECNKVSENVSGFDAIVTTGGYTNTNDKNDRHFLEAEILMLRQSIVKNIPILGISLGAQLVSQACNAAIIKQDESSEGWNNVSLTDMGQRDFLFQGFPKSFKVFQWHKGKIEVPDGGSLLAFSDKNQNQAFRYGNAYGLQFNMEITDDMLAECSGLGNCYKKFSDFKNLECDLLENARIIYNNFLRLVDIRKLSLRRGYLK